MADAAVKKTVKVTAEDFQREIIDFDSESAEGREFMAFSTATAQIYMGFGRWSTVCSAITCWATIAAEP